MRLRRTTEAQHLVIPDPSGEELACAIASALVEGMMEPAEVDYICAHGIGNRDYDSADTRAFKMALGEHAYNIPVSSIKSTTGQPFAAGGSWQAVAGCMAIATGTVPPTINYEQPDPTVIWTTCPTGTSCTREDRHDECAQLAGHMSL